MAWPLRLLLVAAIVLSGCSAAPADEGAMPTDGADAGEAPTVASATTTSAHAAAAKPVQPTAEADVDLRGHVLTASLHPIEGARVAVIGLDQTRTTGADGAFDFGELARRIYTLQASAPGYQATNLTVTPDEAADSVDLVLEAGYPVVPYNTTVHFRGILECAFEALIISPSCDSALAFVGGPPVFDQNQSFLFQAEPGWKTLVLDLGFDGDAHPGLDGLRLTLRGSLDPDSGGEYVQYGRWHDAHAFTARVEPGGNYTDGVEVVPGNATGFQADVYPHGHAYHQACAGDSCFLGAGAALNVEFDLYATLFYVEPAPEGFTLLGTA